MPESKIFVFGPQALSFNALSFKSLHAKLDRDDLLDWALDVLSTLPKTLTSLATEIPKLRVIDERRALEALVKAMRTGELSADIFPLPNVLLSPLVVIAQLAEYMAYIKAVEPTLNTTAPISTSITTNAETLGLCTGILSAVAVASSATIADLKRHGAASVRLAVLSGALVDAEDASRDTEKKSVSFSASWAAASLEDLEAILQKYPEVRYEL